MADRNESDTDRFAGINDHLHSRDLLSRVREPATAEAAMWPALKDVLESVVEIMVVLNEGRFGKITQKSGLKIVYTMIALLSEGKYDVIKPVPNREVKAMNPRLLRSELLAA